MLKKLTSMLKEVFAGRPEFESIFIPEDYLLRKDVDLNLSELDTIVAHDVKINITFILVKFHEGPQSYYSWRKSNVSGLFVLSENRFDSMDEAIRAMAAEEWECNFYRII